MFSGEKINELFLAVLVIYFRQTFANNIYHNNQRIILVVPQGNQESVFIYFFCNIISAYLENNFDLVMKCRV